MEQKILKRFVYEGFGFPVVLRHVPARKVNSIWVPFINYCELARTVLRLLCFREEPLSGSEIFFIRHTIGLTGEQMANLLGVTQAAISKWERKKSGLAKVEPAIEFCLRVLALEHLEKGGSENLRKMFLKNKLLINLKRKQKAEGFSAPSISCNLSAACGY